MSYALKISKDHDGRRLDRTLRTIFKYVPLNEIMKAIRKGEIRINGVKVREPGQHISAGDELLTSWPIKEEEQAKIFKYDDLGRIKIIYQDENLILLNKPAGILVQPDISGGDSVITRVWGVFNSKSPAAVHRLDRNTTGILCVALNGMALRALEKIFKDRTINKKYLAIVDGEINNNIIEIDAPLLKDSEKNTVTVSHEKGLKAVSRVKKLCGDEKFTLVEIELLTGRTHQARVHMSYIKHPIIGDRKYGKFHPDKKFNRPFLHAYKIKFPDNMPDFLNNINNKEFSAPIPEDIKNFIESRNWKIKL